jgi:hypothetical protein
MSALALSSISATARSTLGSSGSAQKSSFIAYNTLRLDKLTHITSLMTLRVSGPKLIEGSQVLLCCHPVLAETSNYWAGIIVWIVHHHVRQWHRDNWPGSAVGRRLIGSRATAQLPRWTDCPSPHSRIRKRNQDLPMRLIMLAALSKLLTS